MILVFRGTTIHVPYNKVADVLDYLDDNAVIYDIGTDIFEQTVCSLLAY